MMTPRLLGLEGSAMTLEVDLPTLTGPEPVDERRDAADQKLGGLSGGKCVRFGRLAARALAAVGEDGLREGTAVSAA